MPGGKAAAMKVIAEINATMRRQDALRADGDLAAVHRIEDVVGALWLRMNENMGDEPAEPTAHPGTIIALTGTVLSTAAS